jgi:glycosyltransferase involved in cell wall biosynthesis
MASRLPRFLASSLAEVVRHRLGGMLRRNRSTARTPPGANRDELIVLRMERHAVDAGKLYSETSFVHWLEEAQRHGRLTLVARGVPRPRLKTSGEMAPGIPLGPGCRFLSAGPAQGILGALLGSFRITLALLRARCRGADVLVRVPEHSSFVTAPLLFLLGFKVHVWVVANRTGMLQSMLAFASRPRRLALRLAYGINAVAERFLLRRARTLFTNGAEIMSQFGRAARGRDPVVLVSSTISQAHVAWTRARREALRKQRATDAEPTTVVRGLCVARLTWEKGHDFLLECMRASADSGTRLQVRLVGVEDPGHGDRLRAIATDLDVADQVEFVGALPFGNRLFEEYASADCVVLSSRMEGTPRVLAEAYMLGLPIIATRVGGIASSYAGQEQDGVYLIEFGDHAAFAAALDQVMAWIRAGRPAFPRTRDRSVSACVRTMIERIQAEQRISRSRRRLAAGIGDPR